MKFLIIGDLHGDIPRIYFKDFDAIIAPGDFCSDKELRLLYNKYFKYLREYPKTKLEFEAFYKKILKLKGSQISKMSENSIKAGRKIIEKLNSYNKPVFLVPGNWDQSYKKVEAYKGNDKLKIYRELYRCYSARHTNKKLIKGLKNIYDCQFKLYKLGDFNIIGYGLASNPEMPEKKKVKSKLKYKKINKEFEKFFSLLSNEYKKRDINKPTIFITHDVPYGTPLDKIVDKNSPIDGLHYGSIVALEFCKRYRPLVCIGGHMHEHFGKCKIGKTTVINAGFGSFVNVLLELSDGKIKKIEFCNNGKVSTYG